MKTVGWGISCHRVKKSSLLYDRAHQRREFNRILPIESIIAIQTEQNIEKEIEPTVPELITVRLEARSVYVTLQLFSLGGAEDTS